MRGYTIYRTSTGEDPGEPVATVDETKTTYEDKAPYARYTYRVTALAAKEPAIAESAPSLSADVDFRDLLAPPVPKSLVALAEETSVRLVWDPVAAPDLAGYVVYREVAGARTRLNPSLLTEASFRDEAPPLNAPIVYSVTSVDLEGNESAAAKAAEVVITR